MVTQFSTERGKEKLVSTQTPKKLFTKVKKANMKSEMRTKRGGGGIFAAPTI